MNDIDPGQCDKSNHASQVLILDRENKEKILICTKNNGEYQWALLGGLCYESTISVNNHTHVCTTLVCSN